MLEKFFFKLNCARKTSFGEKSNQMKNAKERKEKKNEVKRDDVSTSKFGVTNQVHVTAVMRLGRLRW